MHLSQIALKARRLPAVACAAIIVLSAAEQVRAELSLEGIGHFGIFRPPVNVQVETPPPNVLGPFNIVLQFNNAPTAQEQAAFTAAETMWESFITGFQQSVPEANLTITVNLAPIDGPGNILGSAGPDFVWLTPNFIYSDSGVMNFDTADTAALAVSGALNSVIAHEMGHVIGIGTLWSATGAIGAPGAGKQEVYVNNSGQYTGAFGKNAYNAEFSQVGASVPVELGGGGGTANAHWNEVNGGGANTGITNSLGQDFRNELMTGWLNSPTFISNLTVQSLRDIGYNVVAIPEVSAFAMMLLPSSLALLISGRAYFSRRRDQSAPHIESEQA